MQGGSAPSVVFVASTLAQIMDALAVADQLPDRVDVTLLDVRPNRGSNHFVPVPSCRRTLTVKRLGCQIRGRIQQGVQVLLVRKWLCRLAQVSSRFVVVLGDDVYPVERAAVLACRRLGIPTVLIVDGQIEEAADEAKALAAAAPKDWGHATFKWISRRLGVLSEGHLYGLGGCDRICVWGESTRDLFLRRGVPSAALSVTGSPRFDQWWSIGTGSATHAPERAEPRVLVAWLLLSAWQWANRDQDIDFLRSLHDFAIQRPKWSLCLRPHPSVDGALYRTCLSNLGSTPLRMESDRPLREALSTADIVLMNFPSTLAVEAMILDKPVVFLDPGGSDVHVDFVEQEAILAQKPPWELQSTLPRLLPQESFRSQRLLRQRSFLQKTFDHRDAGSAARVASIIEKLLQELPSQIRGC